MNSISTETTERNDEIINEKKKISTDFAEERIRRTPDRKRFTTNEFSTIIDDEIS